MNQQRKNFYEFGPFRIDQVERLLRRGTEVIPLPPKAIDMLLALVESSGQAVEKDALMKRVWPGTFVEEGSLAQNVSLLRKVLGESPKARYIETIAKKGYRFVAPVTEVREDNTGSLSLAVLPLANLSGDPAQDFFADGMTDELISYLMKVEALRVTSRTSVMVYKNINKPLHQVARELNVAWVVEGTVLHSGNRVRISARVIDGSTEKHGWAGTYEREMRDVLTLQSEVASNIAREIGVNVTAPERVRLAKSRPVNPQAYEMYLRGRYLWNNRTPEGLKRAAQCFHQAIEEDPTYAPSHTGLADAYSLLGSIGYDGMPPREAMPLAKTAANNAIKIDDTSAEAHASLGYVKLSYDWDWAGAESEFKRAIELNPSYATAHDWYGHCLFAMGRLDEAGRQMQYARELDPLSIPCNLGVGWSFYYARQYDQAIEQYRKTLEIAPNLPMVLYELGLAYLNKGLYQEALAEFQKAYELSGGAPAAVALLGHAYALAGRTAEARQELARLHEVSKQKYVPSLYRAFIYAGLNDKDQAFLWLEKAYEDRSNYLIYLGVEPSIDNLRSDPRYHDLLRRVGLER
jgi:TolB-like protein/tetratricopeptide (TPR) repeat protein